MLSSLLCSLLVLGGLALRRFLGFSKPLFIVRISCQLVLLIFFHHLPDRSAIFISFCCSEMSHTPWSRASFAFCSCRASSALASMAMEASSICSVILSKIVSCSFTFEVISLFALYALGYSFCCICLTCQQLLLQHQ